ncbi:MAG: KpsF/GutQ family sugar-phosphate isomerase [Chlamydiales bacterium]|nr:KpsF/GutQ family sugar-phosphate isomerase [Chlamydiales bacterium]
METIADLKRLFESQKKYIDAFFDGIDIKKAYEIFFAMVQCKGTIVFSGVGKSGIVAQKLAMTLVSVGTKALYLNPLDALHGDIGVLNHDDLLIVISKSGSTKEILHLLPAVKKRNVTVIAWISNEHSPLTLTADIAIYLPLERELCPFDLAPTTSPSIQMIFGDVLIAAIMQAKKFSLEAYALNHPAGAIGLQIAYSVKELMVKQDKLPTCYADDLLRDAIIELTNKKCGCILIIDDQGKLLGIFTDGDLRRSIQQYAEKVFSMPMRSLMTTTFLSIDPHAPAFNAVKLMQQHSHKRVMMLPVVEEKKLVGLICLHDIVETGVK